MQSAAFYGAETEAHMIEVMIEIFAWMEGGKEMAFQASERLEEMGGEMRSADPARFREGSATHEQ